MRDREKAAAAGGVGGVGRDDVPQSSEVDVEVEVCALLGKVGTSLGISLASDLASPEALQDLCHVLLLQRHTDPQTHTHTHTHTHPPLPPPASPSSPSPSPSSVPIVSTLQVLRDLRLLVDLRAYQEAELLNILPWLHARLMILGQGRAGKSSTFRALMGRPFDSDLCSTVGIAVDCCSTSKAILPQGAIL